MAKENITKFFDAAMTDKVLAERLAALAAEKGHNFIAGELLAARKHQTTSFRLQEAV